MKSPGMLPTWGISWTGCGVPVFFEAAVACFGPGMSSAVRNLVCKG
jgi:hypothetical protein